jgi:hypothetical protein
MSLKHLTIGALVAVCITVAPAAAQKSELTGILGRTFISNQGIKGAASFDQNVHFGKGFTFEVNYARRIFDADLWSLSVEVPFLANPDEDVHSALGVTPRQFSSIFITPAARLSPFLIRRSLLGSVLGGDLAILTVVPRLNMGLRTRARAEPRQASCRPVWDSM